MKEVRQTFSKCHEFDELLVKWKLIKIFSTFKNVNIFWEQAGTEQCFKTILVQLNIANTLGYDFSFVFGRGDVETNNLDQLG